MSPSAPPYPLPLDVFGRPDCHLYQAAVVQLPRAVDAFGNAELRFDAPNGAGVVNARIQAQWLTFAGPNLAAASTYFALLFGR